MTDIEDAQARIRDASRRGRRARAHKRNVLQSEALDELLIERSRALLADSRALLDREDSRPNLIPLWGHQGPSAKRP
jgi:hypothetical protein